MLRNAALVSAVAIASLASSAEAGFWRWTYNNPSHTWFKSMTAEFDPATKRFKWDFTTGTQTNGYWLALSPGPNPKGHAGELACRLGDAQSIAADLETNCDRLEAALRVARNEGLLLFPAPGAHDLEAGGLQEPQRIDA